MADQTARGEEFEKKAEKKLAGWGLFGSKYEDGADLYDKAANCFKLGKNWEKAGAIYTKLANCHLKLESKHDAASAYVDAANSYKKISAQGSYTNWRKGIFNPPLFGVEEVQNLQICKVEMRYNL